MGDCQRRPTAPSNHPHPTAAGFGGSGNVDGCGFYRIGAVVPGEYEVCARLEPAETDNHGYDYAVECTVIEVRDGEQAGAPTLVLRLVRKHRVAGRVEDFSGLKEPRLLGVYAANHGTPNRP